MKLNRSLGSSTAQQQPSQLITVKYEQISSVGDHLLQLAAAHRLMMVEISAQSHISQCNLCVLLRSQVPAFMDHL